MVHALPRRENRDSRPRLIARSGSAGAVLSPLGMHHRNGGPSRSLNRSRRKTASAASFDYTSRAPDTAPPRPSEATAVRGPLARRRHAQSRAQALAGNALSAAPSTAEHAAEHERGEKSFFFTDDLRRESPPVHPHLDDIIRLHFLRITHRHPVMRRDRIP